MSTEYEQGKLPLEIADWVEWANDNPDLAIAYFPEIERYIRWKTAPFRPIKTEDGKMRSGRLPFITRGGRSVD